MTNILFPNDFIFGVATSSYQIEGAVNKDGRGESIWDRFSATAGNIYDGSSGEVACNHYELWQNDLDLIKDLGFQAYRFSIAWPRILPEGRGKINQKGLDFYDRLVDGLLERGLEPHVTLYHWDLPQKLQDNGGWLNRYTVSAFSEYADTVTKRLGNRVRSYATLNEPWCSSYLGYGNGHHAPGLADKKMFLQAAHNLLLAHGSALPPMRSNAPESQHGIVLNFSPAYPASDKKEDIMAAKRQKGFQYEWFLDPILKAKYPALMLEAYQNDLPEIKPDDLTTIAAKIDFLGVNMYTRSLVKYSKDKWLNMDNVIEDVPRTAMGWEIFPDGLEQLLIDLNNDYKLPPVFITENGAAFDDKLINGRIKDQNRIDFYQGHLKAVSNAIQRGVDVRGYFAWSFMDNFEWAFGYEKRFGIVFVDFETQKRTPKDSAKWFTELLQNIKSKP